MATSSSTFRRTILGLALACILPAGEAWAQAKSPTDGFTPLAMTPGSPAGSFALSGFESVNLFNGNLSFHLPLLRVEGRGEAAYTMTLTIERRINFRFSHKANEHDIRGIYIPEWNWFERYPGLSPGVMSSRTAVQEVRGSEETALTRLTFTSADGTEYEFRDTVYGGRPVRAPNNPNPTSRGRTFLASDGSAAMFVSDQELLDRPGQGLTGWLYLRNGTRYRTDFFGRVVQIVDRNGNTIDLQYTGLDVSRVTDSLGRIITVTTAADVAGKLSQEIRYKGSRGVERQITIHYDDLANVLSGPSLCEGGGVCQCSDLFPPVQFDAYDRPCNPRVVASVELPNQDSTYGGGTRYDFKYNEYSELTQVQLPTGGTYEYAWESGTGSGAGIIELPFNDDSRSYAWGVYRRVNSRKLFNYDHGTPEQSTVYAGCPPEEQRSCFQATHLSPANGATLGSERHYFHGEPTDSYFREPCDYPDPLGGREAFFRIYEGTGTDDQWVRQITNDWEEGAPIPCAPDNDCASLYLAANLRLKRVGTQLDDRQQSKVEYGYDTFNNVTSKKEFDYGAKVPSRTTGTAFQGSRPYVEAHLLSLPYTETVSDTVAMSSKTIFVYDEGDLLGRPGMVGWSDPGTRWRGNVTRTIRYLDSPRPGEPNEVVTERKYDQAGNVWRIKDPLAHETTLFYDDNFGPPDGAAQPQEPGRNSFAFPTLMRNALRHETRRQYDYSTGKVVDEQDANGTVTSFYHDDPLDRLTLIEKAANPGYEAYLSRTGFVYLDGRYSREVRTYADKDQPGDAYVQHRAKYDEMGREFISQARDTDPQGGFIEVEKRYDARGRVSHVSNPRNEPNDPSVLWTTTQYDILDRPIRVTTPDQATVVTNYSGNQTTVNDQTGRARSSTTDALGRVTKVIEDPDGLSYETSYGYDGLDQLTGMQQGKPSQDTTQSRTFTYDTLGRLRRALNPESGETRYEYDLAGNLRERTDARGVKTVTDYDLLNRPKTRTYNDGTPGVTYTYDEAALGSFAIGRLTSVGNAYSKTDYHHDPLGRVFRSSQKTATATGRIVTHGFVYGYNRQDHLVSEQYPSGRVVNTEYDDQIRVTKVLDAHGTYASDFTYWVHGAPKSMKLGNGLWETTDFNARLQPTLMGLGTASGAPPTFLSLEYEYWPEGSPSFNNGNVFKQTITLSGGALTQRYTYDGVNRLATAQEVSVQPWSQTYAYDRFGNRVVTAGYFPQPGLTPTDLGLHYDASTNRIKMGASASLNAYDAAGNQLADPLGHVSSYDAENRLASTNGGVTTYGYGGEGRRVLKTVDGVTTFFVYDALGRLAAEYGGQSLATGTRFLTQDPLGSVRIVTDAYMTVVARHDYLPFGEEIPKTLGGRTSLGGYGSFDAIRQRFTAKERDTESGLDYFGARYFSGAQGRFTSPDPRSVGADPMNPQSWNGYAYALNNPLKYVDPDGESATLAVGLLGGVFGGVTAIVRSALNRELPTGRQIVAATVGGAVYGGMMGSVIDSGGTTLPALLAAGAMSGAAAVTAQNLLLGQTTTTGDLAEGSAAGMVGAMMMAPAVETLSTPTSNATGESALGPSVQANKAKGDAFRDELANSLRQQGRDVKTEVTKQTLFGPRRLDLEVRQNGKILGGVETKVGRSRYLPSQQAKDWYLETFLQYRVDLVRKDD